MEIKTTSFEQCEVKFAQTEGAFSGYGSTFSTKDSHGDIVMPGAFADVIKSGNPVMLYVNHGWMRGDLPVGKWDGLAEDHVGLKGATQIEMRMPTGANAYYALKAELVSGLSIGFQVHPDGVEKKSDGTRCIHRIKVLKEISIVDSPSNTFARVTDVKSADLLLEVEQIKSIRDFEHFLRDASGFSKGAAQALTARVKTMFAERDASEDQQTKHAAEILERIQRLAA